MSKRRSCSEQRIVTCCRKEFIVLGAMADEADGRVLFYAVGIDVADAAVSADQFGAAGSFRLPHPATRAAGSRRGPDRGTRPGTSGLRSRILPRSVRQHQLVPRGAAVLGAGCDLRAVQRKPLLGRKGLQRNGFPLGFTERSLLPVDDLWRRLVRQFPLSIGRSLRDIVAKAYRPLVPGHAP